jgi:hypothetical protein
MLKLDAEAKLVLGYGVVVLTYLMPMMPFVPGTAPFAYAAVVSGGILTTASLVTLRGLRRLPGDLVPRYSIRRKLTIIALATTLVGAGMVVLAVRWLLGFR